MFILTFPNPAFNQLFVLTSKEDIMKMCDPKGLHDLKHCLNTSIDNDFYIAHGKSNWFYLIKNTDSLLKKESKQTTVYAVPYSGTTSAFSTYGTLSHLMKNLI